MRATTARDFKRHLKVERGWKPASVNLALAAVDHFNRFLGLGPASVKREQLAQAAPRALSRVADRVLDAGRGGLAAAWKQDRRDTAGVRAVLKFFELEGRFPRDPGELAAAAVDYVAGLVRVP